MAVAGSIAGESGAVIAWGDGNFGQTQVPTNLNDVIGVASGGYHSLALRSNGTVVAWGSQMFGQSTVPPDLTNVVAIAAGSSDSVALRSDGTVVGWGLVGVRSGLTNIKAISAGYQHGLGLRSNATVTAWGINNFGQVTVPSGLSNVVAVSAGSYHSLALKADGTVVGWGRNDFGQCIPPAGLTNVIAIGGGNYHSTALRSDGTVVGWGTNWAFEEIANQNQPPLGLSNVVAIAVGAYHNLALRRDGTVVAWGWSGYGVNTVPDGVSAVIAMSANLPNNLLVTKAPIITQQPQDVSISLGDTATFSVGGYGNLPWTFQWYLNGSSLSSQTNAELKLNNVRHADAGNYFVVISNASTTVTSRVAVLSVLNSPSVAATLSRLTMVGDDAELAVHAFGATPMGFRWSHGRDVIPNVDSNVLLLTNVQPQHDGTYIVAVSNAFGITHGLAFLVVAPRRSIVAWGQDQLGQSTVPPGLDNLIAVAAGEDHNVALHPDGRVSVWGSSFQGQNGIPENLSNVVQVAAGRGFSAALRADGSVVVWGETAVDISPPSDLTNVASVAAGRHHALALLEDGRVRAWGEQTNVPPEVQNVIAVAAGWEHSLALRADGVVIAWGDNSYGQSSVPNLTNVVAIAAGAHHSLAVKNDGSVIGWGSNTSGQASPPDWLSNVVEVAAGYSHSIARSSDGSVTTWGGTPDSFVGGPAIGFNGARSIAAGAFHNVVLLDWPVFLRQPQPLTLIQGGNGVLTATVTSQAPHTLQWQLNGTNIPGETNTFLFRSNVTASADGVYTLIASTPYGVTQSDSVRLRVIVPPQIIEQPRDVDVAVGGNATFAVVVGGSPASYRWFFETNLIPGASGPTLTLSNVRASDDGLYSVTVSNAAGVISSIPARLRVHFPPQIVTPPQSTTAGAGQTLALSVTVVGEEPLLYQWYFNGAVLFGASNATLTIPVVQSANQGSYSLRVANLWGEATSPSAVITVTNDLTGALNATNVTWTTGGAAAWFSQTNYTYDGISAAQSGDINHGEQTWMETILSGPGTLNFWWKVSSEEHYDWVALLLGDQEERRISGEMDWHGESVQIPSGDILVRFVYAKDETLSEGADAGWVDQIEFVPDEAPAIVVQPQSTSVLPGESVVFRVTATGRPAPSFQWFFDDQPVPGATASSFKISHAQVADAGYYHVVVGNPFGAVVSDVAELIVRAPPEFRRAPKSQIGFQEGTVVFDAEVDGSGPLACQWFFNDSAITNATNIMLHLSQIKATNEGTYWARVTNPFGTTQSPFVTLTVARNSTTIDFEDQQAPCLISAALTLSLEYASLGATFSGASAGNGAAVLNGCWGPGITGYSGTNFIAFIPGASTAGGNISSTPIVLSFNPPVTAVQLRVGASILGTPMSLDAYNANDTSLDHRSVEMDGTMQPVSVSGTAIVRAVVQSDSPFFWMADDLQFTTVRSIEDAPPKVSLRTEGDNIRISWPWYADGFRLQSTTNAVSQSWEEVSLPVFTNGVNRSVMVPKANEMRFFRVIRE